MYMIGIDIGSVSVDIVVMDEKARVSEALYVRHMGRPIETARKAVSELLTKHNGQIGVIAATGTGAKVFANLIGASFINEIVALTAGFNMLYPDTGCIIDIGGEDSKLIILEKGLHENRLRMKDFSMNMLCAAGTGSFLDQQASRLRFTIEEFSEVALKSNNPPRIAGRCTVFAKSDMIHLQQIATPDYEIVAGLCYALARNFKGNIAKGKEIRHPVAFVGGVAANAGMRKALQDVFALGDNDFFVPEYFTSMGAIGAVCAVLGEPSLRKDFSGFSRLDDYLSQTRDVEAHECLAISKENTAIDYSIKSIDRRMKAFLGVDVGSISTNLVVIDEASNVLSKRYLMTEGRPLEAVKRGLAEIGEEIGNYVDIIGAGTTGSGRYLTADFIGADIVRNEITAQAEAAIHIDPQVDTVFEIGGQDSKYISIDNGVIVDFEMNKACAAGTGSFLEEQAERLGISIKEEFGNMALSSEHPVKMGERCTVFIESDLTRHQQAGIRTDDLVSGLAYSIVTNYLNKVVGDRRIGEKIFFQGGTAFNKGVVAAFERVLKRNVKVPSHHDVTGAIGVARIVMKEMSWDKSNFKGFDLSKRGYEIETFECKGCENLCEIRKVMVEREAPLYYGSRCEKYDVVRRTERIETVDLFKTRNEYLHAADNGNASNEQIGIPMILGMHETLPFWQTFLSELDFFVVPSDVTNKKIIREGVENIIVESCFPIKVSHGHILSLIQKGVKRIFIPSVINIRKLSDDVSNSFACPYAQTIPYTSKASIDFDSREVIVDSPVVYFGGTKEETLRNLIEYGKKVGRSRNAVRGAFEKAMQAQETFYRNCHEKGLEFLSGLSTGEKAMVIIGRPYNSADPGANMNIHKKLMDLGVKSIPMDMLPFLEGIETDDELRSMYWGYGQKILRVARMIKKHKNLYAIYITNFGCGPDSFISHFFKRTMQGKPYLQLEIDEHSADAGVVTRLEAFLDSIKNARAEIRQKPEQTSSFDVNGKKRKIYIPYMSDHGVTLSGAFRACGVDAQVMDESDEQTVYWGRKFTTGKECYPCILTTGDMVKIVKKNGFDPEQTAFFMPSGGGPCRFGQYHRFHRMVLDELGFSNIPIYAPNQDYRLYKELNILGKKFTRLGWWAIVSVDLLTKMLHGIRPYEINMGETDRVYRESLEKVTRSIENGGTDIYPVLREVLKSFLSIRKSNVKKPLIGVVGEIYIRSNKFSNENLIRQIEGFGGEVWLSPITEWVAYVNYINRRRNFKRNGISNMFHYMVTGYIQNKDEHKMEKIFKNHIKYGMEPKIRDILNKASPYVHRSFEGEAILSVGKGVDFIERGIHGMVNAMPFTCMPGTISSAFMKLLQKKYEVPIITIAYDGQGSSNIATRLEAFIYQAKDYMETHDG